MSNQPHHITTAQYQRFVNRLDEIKSSYAEKVCKLITSLPDRDQQIAYWIAKDASYQLSLAMLKTYSKEIQD